MLTSKALLQEYNRIFEKIIQDYREKNDGRYPTIEEIARIMGKSYDAVARLINLIRKRGINPGLRTRGTTRKRNWGVKDEDIVRVYQELLRASSRPPTCQEIGEKLNLDSSAVSSRIRLINKKGKFMILTRGYGRPKRGKAIDIEKLSEKIEEFKRKYHRAPSLDELASFTGFVRRAVFRQIKRLNAERLKRGKELFVWTKKKRNLSPEDFDKCERILPGTALFSELKEAVLSIIFAIESVLMRDSLLKEMSNSRCCFSVSFLREMLSAIKIALRRCLDNNQFFSFDVYGKMFPPAFYCKDKVYLLSSMVDPKSPEYRGIPFLAEIILDAFVSLFFAKEEIKEEIRSLLLSFLSSPVSK